MTPIRLHRGTGVPLDRTEVDTDAIIPARYCLTVQRTGFAPHLFKSWREDPDFPLNDPRRSSATVLVAAADFGTGSSREHAVWALQDWGFRVVISSRFGDIFSTNCAKAGLVAARIDEAPRKELLAAVAADPALEVVVDLVARTVRWTAGGRPRQAAIDMSDSTRRRFLEGTDDIDLTLQHADAIGAYERTNAHWLPSLENGRTT